MPPYGEPVSNQRPTAAARAGSAGSAPAKSSPSPAAQGGDRLHFFLGVNHTHPGGHRFAGELGGPIFQDLNGPQLETDIIYRIGWQFSF